MWLPMAAGVIHVATTESMPRWAGATALVIMATCWLTEVLWCVHVSRTIIVPGDPHDHINDPLMDAPDLGHLHFLDHPPLGLGVPNAWLLDDDDEPIF